MRCEINKRIENAREKEESEFSIGGNAYYYHQGYADALGELLEYIDDNTELDIFDNLETFRKDRDLDSHKFDLETFLRKSYEEDFELQGYEGKYCKEYAKHRSKADIEFRQNPVTTKGTKVKTTDNPFVRVDALGDGIVFRVEAIEQLGFNAKIVMDEIQKEINSRDGEIINGKFEKYTDEASMSKWYKADFHKAKR